MQDPTHSNTISNTDIWKNNINPFRFQIQDIFHLYNNANIFSNPISNIINMITPIQFAVYNNT